MALAQKQDICILFRTAANFRVSQKMLARRSVAGRTYPKEILKLALVHHVRTPFRSLDGGPFRVLKVRTLSTEWTPEDPQVYIRRLTSFCGQPRRRMNARWRGAPGSSPP